MSQADIYKQYLTDYEDAVNKYNRQARHFQNSIDLTSGPIKAIDSVTGQNLGLYKQPTVWNNNGGMGPIRQPDYAVKTGTHAEYMKAMEAYAPKSNQAQASPFEVVKESIENIDAPALEYSKITGYQNPQAKERAAAQKAGNAFGLGGFVENMQDPYANARDDDLVSWGEKVDLPSGTVRDSSGRYFVDVGNGYYAALKGGVRTGQFATNRMTVTPDQFKNMQESGSYKDLKILDSISVDDGERYLVDATSEVIRMPQNPGEFKKKPPSLTLDQIKEIQNPTPTMTDIDRASSSGLVNAVRQRAAMAAEEDEGLISSSR